MMLRFSLRVHVTAPLFGVTQTNLNVLYDFAPDFNYSSRAGHQVVYAMSTIRSHHRTAFRVGRGKCDERVG